MSVVRLRLVFPILLVVLLGACDWGQYGFDAGQQFGDPRLPDWCCAHMTAPRLDTGGQLFSLSMQRFAHDPEPTSAIVSNGTVHVDTPVWV